MLSQFDDIIKGASLEQLDEASVPSNLNDLQRVRHMSNFSSDVDKVAFFKLLMTLSNLHATVSDFYMLREDTRHAKRHYDFSTRFRNEANSVRNS